MSIIELQTNKGTISVEAEIIAGVLAIHPTIALTLDKALFPRYRSYSLTHIGTSIRIASFRTKGSARLVATHILPLADWKTLTFANCPKTLYKQVATVIRDHVKPDHMIYPKPEAVERFAKGD